MPVPIALSYPAAPTSDQVDDYHGVMVADPYRPLEVLDAPLTRAWIDAQTALTRGYLDAIETRSALRARLTELADYPRRGAPTHLGSGYLFSANTGLQNQAVWYRSDTLDGPAHVFLDPNGLSEDGTVALGALSATLDGSLVAYALTHAGSDWQEWHVRSVAGGHDLDDVVRWSKFTGIAWARDNSGFYYGRFAEPSATTQFKAANTGQQIYFHMLGTAQSDDRLVYERPDDPRLLFGIHTTVDGRYLIISEAPGGEKNTLLYADLLAPGAPLVKLFDADAGYTFVWNDATQFFIATDKDAPNGRIVAIDAQATKPLGLRDVVAETSDAMQSAGVIDGKLVVSYLKDAHTAIDIFDRSGAFVHAVALPGVGSASITGRHDRAEAFITFTSYTTPSSILRYDLQTGAQRTYFAPQVAFDPSAFVSEQVFLTSTDGARVPMILTYKRGLTRDGTAPTILYGYGGFNIPVTPAFSVFNIPWFEMGGVLAVVNLRGGSEYGEAWHQAGMLDRKQQVFDDFFAAAGWLIAQRITSPARLAARGGSNGGLLVGAAIAQRPDLFAAAIPQVGVLDMLRYDKFTIGAAWIPEYGSADDPDMFATLRAYSPLHNLHAGTAYPATLVMTADHDDRVFPAHSFKFGAALQAAQGGAAPILVRIETKAGHGAGTPISKSIEEAADVYAFLSQQLGVA